ncbi:MAG: hypothetical protein ACI9U2_003540, partial [Bradymonadia bacterium]
DAGVDGPARCVNEQCCLWSSSDPMCNEQGPRGRTMQGDLAGPRLMLEGRTIFDFGTGQMWVFTGEYEDTVGAAHLACADEGLRLPTLFELYALHDAGAELSNLFDREGDLFDVEDSAFARTITPLQQPLPMRMFLRLGSTTVERDDEPSQAVCVFGDPPPRDPLMRKLRLSATPELGDDLIEDIWTGTAWVNLTETYETTWAQAQSCSALPGANPNPNARVPTISEVLSVWQPNPTGPGAAQNINQNHDWLRLANRGAGLQAFDGNSPQLAGLFFAARQVGPEQPEPQPFIVSFIDGSVQVNDDLEASNGRARCVSTQ